MRYAFILGFFDVGYRHGSFRIRVSKYLVCDFGETIT